MEIQTKFSIGQSVYRESHNLIERWTVIGVQAFVHADDDGVLHQKNTYWLKNDKGRRTGDVEERHLMTRDEAMERFRKERIERFVSLFAPELQEVPFEPQTNQDGGMNVHLIPE